MPIVSMCKRSRALLVKWDSVLFGQAFASCGRDVEFDRFCYNASSLTCAQASPQQERNRAQTAGPAQGSDGTEGAGSCSGLFACVHICWQTAVQVEACQRASGGMYRCMAETLGQYLVSSQKTKKRCLEGAFL